MTDADLQSKLAECEDVIRQLVTKLQETVDENDRLKFLVANLTEGASAHATLQELHRNRDLPAAIRAKAAIGCLGVESAPLKPVEAPLELTAEYEPLADVVARQRALLDRLLALSIEERSAMIAGVVGRDGGNGQDN